MGSKSGNSCDRQRDDRGTRRAHSPTEPGLIEPYAHRNQWELKAAAWNRRPIRAEGHRQKLEHGAQPRTSYVDSYRHMESPEDRTGQVRRRPLAEVRATRKLPSKPLEADVQSTQSSSVVHWPAVQRMPGEDSGLNAVGGSALLLRVSLRGPIALLPRLRSVGATIHVCSSPGFRRRVSDGSSPKQSL